MAGVAADGLVESVDIFPTLAELCGLTPPSGLSGTSFVPLIADAHKNGKPAVCGFWRDGRAHTLRTQQFRLVQWTSQPGRSYVLQTELYDHVSDPNETVNVAAENPEVVTDLLARLRERVPLLKLNK